MLKNAGYSNCEISIIMHPNQAISSKTTHKKRKIIKDIIEGGDGN